MLFMLHVVPWHINFKTDEYYVSPTTPSPPALKGGGEGGVNSCLVCNYVKYTKNNQQKMVRTPWKQDERAALQVKGGNGYGI